VEEVEQVVGILAGHVEPHEERHRSVALADTFETLAEERIASGGLGERQVVSGGLEVIAQESGVVTIARRVDADANATRRLRTGSVFW
jgi:hypothetical protein